MADLQGRPVSASVTEMTEIVLPNDTNPLGGMLGGRLMHLMDIAAAIAGHRHSRRHLVTASVDHLDFLIPIRMGHIVILKSSVNRVWNTSMEIGVKVFADNIVTAECRHCCSAYLTFVALDEQGDKCPIAPVIPETEDEKRRYRQAEERRQDRLAHRKREK